MSLCPALALVTADQLTRRITQVRLVVERLEGIMERLGLQASPADVLRRYQHLPLYRRVEDEGVEDELIHGLMPAKEAVVVPETLVFTNRSGLVRCWCRCCCWLPVFLLVADVAGCWWRPG